MTDDEKIEAVELAFEDVDDIISAYETLEIIAEALDEPIEDVASRYRNIKEGLIDG